MKNSRKNLKKIQEILKSTYPDVKTQLTHRNAFEMLVATILSAQCTDRQVNRVTPALFEALPDPESFADASIKKIEGLIRSTGFYHNKAKNIKNCARKLIEEYEGRVPPVQEELIKLPGVGRKTANCVLASAFGIPGIVVDTHVSRISQRLGFTQNKDPVKIEFDLMKIVPKKEWDDFSLRLIYFGRQTCGARKPDCPNCPVLDLCPYPNKTPGEKR